MFCLCMLVSIVMWLIVLDGSNCFVVIVWCNLVVVLVWYVIVCSDSGLLLLSVYFGGICCLCMNIVLWILVVLLFSIV